MTSPETDAGPRPTSTVPRLAVVDPRDFAVPIEPAVLALRRGAIAGLLFVLLIGLPALTLAGVVEPYNLNRLARYLCFAIAALGVDLIWGYTGILSLCHALFFCLGGYAIGMHLSLPTGGGDVRPEYNNIPQFFFFNSVESLPGWWQPFASLPFAVGAALVVPALVSGVVGFFIFRNRVRGVYFSIITQALAWGAFLAFSRNELLLGGTNGLTNFYRPLNSRSDWIVGLYVLTAVALVACFLLAKRLVRSRFGRVLIAVRDKETRLYFLGYRPEMFKASAFVAAALLAAVGGMLYVPQNGIVTPNVMRVEDSIWMVIWVAVGGRGTLWGAVFGALVANFTYSMLTSDLPQAWPFIQGALFLTVLAFPGGIGQLWTRLEEDVRGGASVRGIVMVLAFVETALVVDKMGLVPAALSFNEFAGLQLKYWILLVTSVALSWGRIAPAGVPLLGLSMLVLSEALGVMPSSAGLGKYLVVLVLFAIYAVRESDLKARLALLRLRRARMRA